jgi:hypothetical protein
MEQGDQIGRIFTYWAIVYFRVVYWKITQVAQIVCYFFHCNTYVDILTKKSFGLHLASEDYKQLES